MVLTNSDYYRTILIRLHLFDGSEIEPGNVYYIEYEDVPSRDGPVPLIRNTELVNYSSAL